MTKITTKDPSVQTLLECLTAERAGFHKRSVSMVRDQIANLREGLVAAGWNLYVAAPRPSGQESRAAYIAALHRHNEVKHWFDHDEAANAKLHVAVRNGWNGNQPVSMMKDRELVEARIAARADKMTADYFDGWVLKLAAKIGKPVASATVTGHLWDGSRLEVKAVDGETQVWRTRCIFNISVLGKIFNQWPTRRES